MPRMARVVVPDIPHHITQRGNRRQEVFFGDQDYRLYLQLLKKFCKRASVDVWAYCLMPNHIHAVLVPKENDGLHRAVGEMHRRYTRQINSREGWRGYLWQGRFASYPMDETHTLAAVRYIEMNPVRAALCTAPEDWPWSSARARLSGMTDDLLQLEPMRSMVGDWRQYLARKTTASDLDVFRRHSRTGRPLGSDAFIDKLETITGRQLRKQKAGRKRRPVVD